MNKIISLLICFLLLFAFPAYCLADEEISDYQNELTSVEDIVEETTQEEAPLNYWVVPLSSQIKISWFEELDQTVEIYISTNGRNFEFVDETNEDYYIIDNLNHREKYYIKLVLKDIEKETEIQAVRVK